MLEDSSADCSISKNMRGYKPSQKSLRLDLQRGNFGQPYIFRFLLICFKVTFAIICGSLAGLLAGFISINIAVPHENSQILFPLMASVVTILVVESFRKNFVEGLLKAIFSTFLILGALTLLTETGLVAARHVGAALGIIFLGTAIAIFSLFTGFFSFSLSYILYIQKQSIFRKINGFFISILSIAAAYTAFYFGVIDNKLSRSLRESNSLPPDIAITVSLSGFLVGFFIVIACYLATNFEDKRWKHFDFLRTWAIVFGTWGSTSFYDLDLTGVNFSKARLANTDLRARTLYRTCFQEATGLERARVDRQYLDLEIPKVQKLLTQACSADRNFRGLNLQGAYLQGADMREFDLTDANLTGADLKRADLRDSLLVRTQLAGADFQGVDLRKNVLIDANLTQADFRDADLRGSILVRAQIARADFTGADLTGICIEDWSVSNQTRFTNVHCDYIYRKYQDEQPSDRYPVDRNFEAGEFASLYQEPEDVVELIFKGTFDFNALSLAFYKLQTKAPELELELKGIEQREQLWVVKVRSSRGHAIERMVLERFSSVYQATSSESAVEVVIKESIYRDYEETKHRLAASEQLVNRLAGITGDQAEALKELSKRSLGNSFVITGSTITNLAGSGQIEYTEAADQIRSVMTQSADSQQVLTSLRSLIAQLKGQNVATSASTQLELIQQVILAEAQQDAGFKQLLMEQQQQIVSAMPKGAIATAVQAAINQLRKGAAA
jgi:uncharacterized protein YjbI with pentapeptide repeats